MAVKLKRAYDLPSPDDGRRYLVERLWPRGVSRESLSVDAWLKELAPSTELRRWYGHASERWPEFARRYEAELDDPDRCEGITRLADEARVGDVTLVFAAKDVEHSGARVLKDVVERLSASK